MKFKTTKVSEQLEISLKFGKLRLRIGKGIPPILTDSTIWILFFYHKHRLLRSGAEKTICKIVIDTNNVGPNNLWIELHVINENINFFNFSVPNDDALRQCEEERAAVFNIPSVYTRARSVHEIFWKVERTRTSAFRRTTVGTDVPLPAWSHQCLP